MFTLTDAPTYLIEHGLLDPSTVIDGRIEAFDVSRRNSAFTVVVDGRHGYLMKQGLGLGGRRMLATEHSNLMALRRPSNGLTRLLPAVHAYDHDHAVVVLQLFHPAESVRSYHTRRQQFSCPVARAIGSALARLHTLSGDRALALHLPNSGPPMALGLHRPLASQLAELTGGQLQVIRLIQSSALACAALDHLRDGWERGCIIHGDIRGDNFLTQPGRRDRTLRLIDWETAQLGDAAWDVAGVLTDFLAFWPLGAEAYGAGAYDSPLTSVTQIQRPIRDFWAAYRDRLPHQASGDLLIRSVRYSGARLLQTALEISQGTSQVQPHAIAVVEVALNIVTRPYEATVHLFGLNLDG